MIYQNIFYILNKHKDHLGIFLKSLKRGGGGIERQIKTPKL